MNIEIYFKLKGASNKTNNITIIIVIITRNNNRHNNSNKKNGKDSRTASAGDLNHTKNVSLLSYRQFVFCANDIQQQTHDTTIAFRLLLIRNIWHFSQKLYAQN